MKKRYAALCAALLSFVIFLVVALWGSTFGIDGGASRALLPGSTAPIDVRISNPHFYPIVVSNLTIRIASITPAHKGAVCKPSNFTLTQAHHFAVRLPAYSSVSMKNIATSTDAWPSLHLTGNTPQLDNGCQGAKITLAYSASGTWWTR